MLKLKFNQIHRISRAPQYSKLTSNLNFSENFIYVLEKQDFSGGRKRILNLVPSKKYPRGSLGRERFSKKDYTREP